MINLHLFLYYKDKFKQHHEGEKNTQEGGLTCVFPNIEFTFKPASSDSEQS